MFERLLNQPPYSFRQSEKEPFLLEGLNELTRYHYEKSPEYKRIIDAAWGGLKTYGSIAEVPYLPVSLFAGLDLQPGAPDHRPPHRHPLSRSGGARRPRSSVTNDVTRWAQRDSNPRRLPCKGSALTS